MGNSENKVSRGFQDVHLRVKAKVNPVREWEGTVQAEINTNWDRKTEEGSRKEGRYLGI